MKKQTNWWTILRIIFVASVLGAIILAAVSCKPKQQLTTTTETLSVQKDKLTPVAVPGEKTNLRARFECDSLNNVLLKNFNELKSKNMNSSFSFANGELDYTAQTVPDTVFIKSTDRYIISKQKKTITLERKVPVVKIEKQRGFYWWIGFTVFWSAIVVGIWKLLTKTKLISFIKTILKIK